MSRKIGIWLPGKGNSKSYGARPVHQIISVIKLIRTSRLSTKELSLSGGGAVGIDAFAVEPIWHKQDSQGHILALKESGLSVHFKVLETFQVVPSLLGILYMIEPPEKTWFGTRFLVSGFGFRVQSLGLRV